MTRITKQSCVYSEVEKVKLSGSASIPMPFFCDAGVVPLNIFRMYLSNYCSNNNQLMTSKYDKKTQTLHIFKVK